MRPVAARVVRSAPLKAAPGAFVCAPVGQAARPGPAPPCKLCASPLRLVVQKNIAATGRFGQLYACLTCGLAQVSDKRL